MSMGARRRRESTRLRAAPGRVLRALLVSALAWSLGTAVRAADDIAWFRIRDVDGQLLSRQIYDQIDSRRQRGDITNQSQWNRRNELQLGVDSYVYHPNLLTLDVAGGPIFEQATFSSDRFDQSQDLVDYNLSVRAGILNAKPYRGSLFYDKSHPTLLVSAGETATTDNQYYGAEFNLLAPVTPVPLHVDASRRDNDLVSATRRAHDRTDRVRARATASVRDYGNSTLDVNLTRQDATNTNPGLAAQTARLDAQTVNLHTHLNLGEARQYDLTNYIDFRHETQQLSFGNVPNRDDLRIALDLRGQHSENLRSFASYHHDSSWRRDLDQHRDGGTAGLNLEPDEHWQLSAGGHGETARSARFTNEFGGIDAGARYRHDLPLGVATLNYGLRFDVRSQRQRGAALDVFGEQVVLDAFNERALNELRVVGGSLLVSDLNRTREFVEGIDYELVVVGLETRLRRLAAGAILDGETVLVDYSIELGGDYNSLEQFHSYGATWQLGSNLQVQYQGNLSDISVTSGQPTFVLNEAQNDRFSLHADYPLPFRREVSVGADLEYEIRDATVESYTRNQVELFARAPLPWLARASLRIGVRRTGIEHDFDAGDTDLRALDLNLFSQHRYVRISLDASYEEDVGSIVPRERLAVGLHASGRYRRVEIRGEIVHSRERQGAFERDRTHALLELRRSFF